MVGAGGIIQDGGRSVGLAVDGDAFRPPGDRNRLIPTVLQQKTLFGSPHDGHIAAGALVQQYRKDRPVVKGIGAPVRAVALEGGVMNLAVDHLGDIVVLALHHA